MVNEPWLRGRFRTIYHFQPRSMTEQSAWVQKVTCCLQKLTAMVKYVFVVVRIFISRSTCMVLIDCAEIVFPWSRVFLEKRIGSRSAINKFWPCVERECSLPCSQEHATVPVYKDQCSPGYQQGLSRAWYSRGPHVLHCLVSVPFITFVNSDSIEMVKF
jgi:hypothetical protein